VPYLHRTQDSEPHAPIVAYRARSPSGALAAYRHKNARWARRYLPWLYGAFALWNLVNALLGEDIAWTWWRGSLGTPLSPAPGREDHRCGNEDGNEDGCDVS
jgi:hypothetical protein